MANALFSALKTGSPDYAAQNKAAGLNTVFDSTTGKLNVVDAQGNPAALSYNTGGGSRDLRSSANYGNALKALNPGNYQNYITDQETRYPRSNDGGIIGTIGGVFNAAGDAVKGVTHALDAIPGSNYIIPAALTLTGNPELAAAYTGADTYGKTGNIASGFGAAGGSYLGGQLGEFAGSSSSTLAGALGAQGAEDLGGAIGSTVGNRLGNTLATKAAGRVDSTINNIGPTSFTTRTGLMRSSPVQFPGSQQDLSGGSDLQKMTGIATQGVYGGGVDDSSKSYFLNNVNNQLLNSKGSGYNDYNVNPIEEQYLRQLGVSFQPGDSRSVLEGIKRYGVA